VELAVPAAEHHRAGYDPSLPPGHGWSRSPRGPLVPPYDGSPHGPAPEPTLQPDGMLCSTWSCWDPSTEPERTVNSVRARLAVADVAVVGEVAGRTTVFSPVRARAIQKEIDAGTWHLYRNEQSRPPGAYPATRIRVVHRVKGPEQEEILILAGGSWTEGQQIIVFGTATDPEEGFPPDVYRTASDDSLCVRWGRPAREKLESCSGRVKVPWDELVAIMQQQAVPATEGE
jgi:hypothetical protein